MKDHWISNYDWFALKNQLLSNLREFGVDLIGVADARPFTELRERLNQWHDNGWASGFEERDVDLRTEPNRALESGSARSIISIAIAYPSKLLNPPKSELGAYRGVIARSAWGEDYHTVLRDRLQRIRTWLISRVPEAEIVSMVDTGVLSDRAVAERAGIGFSGKNCSIISPSMGSWLYLGELVTNLPFEADIPMLDQCGTCTKCIDACPTGALVGPGQLNAQTCISLITQLKGVLDDDQKKHIGNRLYGCDTCQVVCPYNKGMDWHLHQELEPDPALAKPLLKPLISMSQRVFRDQFGRTAAAWRGNAPIRRNAIIGLGHFRDVTAVPELTRAMNEDARVEIREAAVWALGRIGTDDARDALVNRLASNLEGTEVVMKALQQALATLK